MNHFNLSDSDETANPEPLINDQVIDVIQFFLYIMTSLCVSICGIVANAINMAVFFKQGIKDSSTVQFFSLSLTDDLVCVLVLITSLNALMSKATPNVTLFDPFLILYYLSPIKEKAYSLSIFITIFLSVERCFCVLFPFNLKRIFTKNRSVKLILCVTFICGLMLIPEYISEGFRWRLDSRFNTTRLIFWQSEYRISFTLFKNGIHSALLPVIACVTNTTCATILIDKTKKSRYFKNMNVPTTPNVKCSKRKNGNFTKKSSPNRVVFSNKEIRLAKTVITVDIIFIICNSSKWMFFACTIVEYLMPELGVFHSGIYPNLMFITIIVTFTMETVNASVSLIVYYCSSMRFRSEFKQMFCNYVVFK